MTSSGADFSGWLNHQYAIFCVTESDGSDHFLGDSGSPEDEPKEYSGEWGSLMGIPLTSPMFAFMDALNKLIPLLFFT